jgi:predicted nucleotidyltransferase
MERHGITIDSEAIQTFCRRRRIKELFVFGSFLRDDFKPDSDVDFIVRMEAGVRLRFRKLLDMEDELSALVGRPVDIVLGTEIDSPDANPYRRKHILATMEPLYSS